MAELPGEGRLALDELEERLGVAYAARTYADLEPVTAAHQHHRSGEAEVRVNGVGIMGGFDHRASGTGATDGPRITVNGLAFRGGVDVRRLPSEEERQRRKRERKWLKREREIEG